MVKTKTPLDQTQLNAVKQTPYMDIESEIEDKTKAEILKAKAVVMMDPLTGKALGAADFFLTMQADAAISQNNPVSTTLYTVLDTVTNARIIGASAKITWAVTQPTPLEILVTVDGQVLDFYRDNPTTAVDYIAWIAPYNANNAQGPMDARASTGADCSKAFLLEGRSVKVQVRITWAVTQPSPLVCRVKYAKR